MQALLEASKSAEGREELLSSGQLAGLAREAAQVFSKRDDLVRFTSTLNGQSTTEHVLHLRLLRNSCAVGAAAATLLQQYNIPQVVADAAAHVAVCCDKLQQQLDSLHGAQPDCNAAAGQQQLPSEQQQQQFQELLLAAVQLLHNLSATGAEGAAAVWSALFPSALDSILLSSEDRVHEVLALTCLSCARSSLKALQDLTSAAAHSAWHRLLAPLMPQAQQTGAAHAEGPASASSAPEQAAQAGAAEAAAAQAALHAVPAGNDNLCLLVKFVAMQQNQLPQLMHLLSQPEQTSSGAAGTGALQASEQHAVLLHVLALEAAAVPAASPLPGLSLDKVDKGSSESSSAAASARTTWLQYTVQLLQDVWGTVTAAAAPAAGVCDSPTPTAHLLEAVLQVLKAVLARDEDAARGVKPGKDAEAAAAAGLAAVAQYLHSLGLLQQLLQMLTALGPPPKNKQQQQRELEEQQRQQQGQAPPAQQPPPPQHQQPYAGYRADVVAVLSNMMLGGGEVQDALMAAGGIELLLNNCNLDESAPMAREWALWGIRNACKDNEGVQGYVAQFQAVDAVQSPELDKMGMQLELDQMTHKLKLSKKQDAP